MPDRSVLEEELAAARGAHDDECDRGEQAASPLPRQARADRPAVLAADAAIVASERL